MTGDNNTDDITNQGESNLRNPNPLRDELLLNHKFTLGKDGDLAVPLDKPGLGVQVDMEALERFTVKREVV